MGTRADLVAVAASSAAAAKDADGPVARREHAEAAKLALEAAALADDLGPGEITAALNALQEELEAAGVLAESVVLEPIEFLRLTLRAVTTWQREAAEGAAYVQAYVGLRDLCQRLERDFIAGDTETSRRIAARIHTGLDEAAQIIKQAAGEETDGEQ